MGSGQWIREKKTDCGGEWRTVELFAIGEQEHRQARRKKCRESSPRQKNKNRMASLRRKMRKVLANFDRRGFYVTATYEAAYAPADLEECRRDAKNYRTRVTRACRRRFGVEPQAVKMILFPVRNGSGGKLHIHGLVQVDGMDQAQRRELRELLEDLWRRKIPGCGEFESLGTINVDRLNMRAVLASSKRSKWGTVGYIYSHKERCCVEGGALILPEMLRDADSRWSRKQLRKGCRECMQDPYWWERWYPGWSVEKILVFDPGELHESSGEPGEWEQTEPQAFLVLRRRGYRSADGEVRAAKART